MTIKSEDTRAKRHRRVRKRVSGTAERPRLNVFRSARHIYAQVITDNDGRVLAVASTLDTDLRTRLGDAAKVDAARLVGELVARRAREKGISKVVFDRGGYLYHGRVAAVAEGARQGGLDF